MFPLSRICVTIKNKYKYVKQECDTVSKHLFQADCVATANDAGRNSCNDQHQAVTVSNSPLPNWWKRIKAIQVLEENKK